MIKCGHALTFKIYTAGTWARWPVVQLIYCSEFLHFWAFSAVADHYKPMKPSWKRNGILLWLYRKNWGYTSQFLLADYAVTFCLSSSWQEVFIFIPSYLNFLYSHECNGRCYFWHSEKSGGEVVLAQNCSGILFRALVAPCWVKAALFPLVLSATMWCVWTELQRAAKATTASSIMTSIFAWVVPFTLLNSVTAECKKKKVKRVERVLLWSVCQGPFKADSIGQAVHAAIEGFSHNTHWQDIVCSARRLPLCNDEGINGNNSFFSGNIVYEVYKAYFCGGRRPDGHNKQLLEKEKCIGEHRGYRCVCVSFNVEPRCKNFLLSFWKSGFLLRGNQQSVPMLMCADVSSAGCDGLTLSGWREGVCWDST